MLHTVNQRPRLTVFITWKVNLNIAGYRPPACTANRFLFVKFYKALKYIVKCIHINSALLSAVLK